MPAKCEEDIRLRKVRASSVSADLVADTVRKGVDEVCCQNRTEALVRSACQRGMIEDAYQSVKEPIQPAVRQVSFQSTERSFCTMLRLQTCR